MDRLEQLEQCLTETRDRLDATVHRLGRSERRGRVMLVVAIVSVLGAGALGMIPEAAAQFGITLTSLHNRLLVVEQKTAPVTVNGTEYVITGKNVSIVDGFGQTFDPNGPSGLGNLTIGYNEPRVNGNVRTGAHTLILGRNNNYSSAGGMVAGNFNETSGSYAVVSGGSFNIAGENLSWVGGGAGNRALGVAASVSGGLENTASGYISSISGGASNTASGDESSISGGHARTVTGLFDWRAGDLFEDD
jgi:hypothetical protein